MALPLAVQGAKRPSPVITWQISDDEVLDLTGATLTGKIASPYSGTRDIDGVLTVTDGPNGVFTWVYGDADVSEAGRFIVQFTASYASGPTPARNLLHEWIVGASA